MKRLIPLFLMCACIGLYAQPREMGLRVGAGGMEAAYQHSMSSTGFIEGDLGLDFGYNANGRPGIKVTASYNYIWAQPAWTARGAWSIYTGPGLSIGFVDDLVPYEIDDKISGYCDGGFMVGLVANIGVEYEFSVPLSITLEVRPCFGIHMNDGRFKIPGTDFTGEYGGKTGFYDNGLLGFIPSVSLRYRF